MRVRAKEENGVNREMLCVRGRFGLDFVESRDRIKRPMIRRDGALVPVSWDEAGDHLRRRLAAVESKAAGGLASSRLPNEVLYQFQKLMRAVFRTNNIDCSARWSTPFDTLGPLLASFYTRAPLQDVIGNDCVLVIGGNVTEENPVTEYLLRDAARRRRTGFLMLAARPSRLDADARQVVRVPPGGEAASLAAVVAGLMKEKSPADRIVAASWAMLGDRKKARQHRMRALKVNPTFDVDKWLAVIPFKEQWQKDLYREGLKKAGF